MIEPGKITLELLMNNPVYYIAFVYVGALIISASSAWWADRQADNKLKQDAKTINPDATPEQLNNIYEFENIRDPILAGVLVCIVAVFPFASSIDTVSGWQGVYATAVLAGITARAVLAKAAASFLSKSEKKP